jgi:hypothetical protein
MANELAIYEIGGFVGGAAGTIMPSSLATSQYVDAGSLSSAFGSDTQVVRLKNLGDAALYIKFGDSSASAAANTAGNHVLLAGESEDFYLSRGHTHLDTASA